MDGYPHRNRPKRRSIRLRGHDYSGAGAYFLTICSHQHRCIFSEILGGNVLLTAIGEIIRDEWLRTPMVRPHVEVNAEELVVMPNHLHGIIWIMPDETQEPLNEPLPRPAIAAGPAHNSVGAIVGQFKAAATRRINALRGTPGQPVWQRNYYEHVIRNESSHARIQEYIAGNPIRWHQDRFHPSRP
jgi:putative transposase